MLGNSDIMTFLTTAQPERSKEFYEKTLGLTFRVDDGFGLVFDANGITLRIAKMPTVKPAPFTVLGWKVENLTAKMDELSEKGITFERFEGLQQDEHGICTFPGGAKVVWFKDPDGNMLSLTDS